MSDLRKLEDLYNRKIKIDDDGGFYRGLLNSMMNDVLIPGMKETSPDFGKLYQRIYYGGSTFDGLKIGSTDQEFDLNVLFKWNPHHCEILNPGDTKKNFVPIKVTKPNLSNSELQIVDEYDNRRIDIISPLKMFNLLKSSVDRTLQNFNHQFQYQGRVFTVRRHEYAPVTLKVEGDGVFFEVDLVPSIEFDFRSLPREMEGRVSRIADGYQVPDHARSFMAISLHRADQQKFEIDFHNIERSILFDRGCVKKVIKLLKFMRDEKGGTMMKLWSHLLKTSVMHLVMRTDQRFWNNENLSNCFVEAIRNLLVGLQTRDIRDIFFPEVNLLSRIKNPQILDDVTRFLQRRVNSFNQTGDILAFFS